MNNQEAFKYDVLHEWSRSFYADLITLSHQIGDRKPINFGTKDAPDIRIYYLFKKDLKIYALPEDHIGDLPILVVESFKKTHYQGVYDIITSYKSAKFKPVRVLSFRQLADDLCCFEHESPTDYTLWKILALSSLIGRTAFRVCSLPAFGKDSVMKVLGYLTSDVCVISNPTVAKLEYRLTNKVLLLNEFANLKSDDRHGMEHFLQSVGDMSNTYEKRSRASQGAGESFNIGDLSVVCAYNDLDCYTGDGKYFDEVFSKQTKDRFIPFKLKGKIAQQISVVSDPVGIAKDHNEYLQGFVRSISYYRREWRNELIEKRSWNVKTAVEYGFSGRWASNFDRIRDFVLLYSETVEEANHLLNCLYNRHVDYLEQLNQGLGLNKDWIPRVSEELVVVHDETLKD